MRLEKLYCVTSEAPSIASAPAAILSPYQEEMARLRLERLRLEEEHLKELNRLATLERIRGPKPKWYELKDTQFHFEAMKNNDLIRTQDRWREELKKHELDRSEEFQQRRTRTVSF
nr:hypothetical protein BaRGS_009371 [Batillaria attramentaria]